jgi:CRISPR-associated protein Cmr3
MPIWIVEPRDPLIVRDGRPFGPNPGARARSLPFPFPSTTTGGVRTKAGLDQNGIFDTSRIPAVKAIRVRGPLLVELGEGYKIKEWLVSAPLDALLLPLPAGDPESETHVQRRRLTPLRLPDSVKIDLSSDLSLVGLVTPDQRKPYKNPPRFWYWRIVQEWLVSPKDDERMTLEELGHSGPLLEQRMHVRIDPQTLTGEEGALFQTSGLEFARPINRDREGTIPVTRLALALATDAQFDEGIAPLGGERRLTRWRSSDNELPRLPEEVKIAIVSSRACRVLLLTPACFKEGYRPTWLLERRQGVKPTLKAVTIQRPHVVSGWDFELGRPKPTRRLAPAGSVYFLSLEGDDAAILQWVEEMWMQCISDEKQDRWDGFGLAALGTWSGQLRAMEVL